MYIEEHKNNNKKENNKKKNKNIYYTNRVQIVFSAVNSSTKTVIFKYTK